MGSKLVYSTNPKVHNILCELGDRKNTLSSPIYSGTRVGYSRSAMIVCEKINQAAKESIVQGQYYACTNRKYRSRRRRVWPKG